MQFRGRLASIRFLTRGRLLWLCLIGLLSFDVGPCLASCGDYLQTSRSSEHLSSEDDVFPQHSSPVPFCHGPQCKRSNSVPVAPNKAIEIPTTGDLILPNITALIRSCHCFSVMIEDPEVLVAPTTRVFRPPRAA